MEPSPVYWNFARKAGNEPEGMYPVKSYKCIISHLSFIVSECILNMAEILRKKIKIYKKIPFCVFVSI